MFRDGKLSFDIKQFFPTNGRQYTFTPVAASRAVSVIMVVGLMLPLPWFTLADGGQSIAGTRLLSYALDGFSSLSYIFSVSPVNAFLFFSLPIVIAVLSLMTLADSIMNKAVNVRGLSVLNIIAMLLLMYVAALIADPTQHAIRRAVRAAQVGTVVFILASSCPCASLGEMDESRPPASVGQSLADKSFSTNASPPANPTIHRVTTDQLPTQTTPLSAPPPDTPRPRSARTYG